MTRSRRALPTARPDARGACLCLVDWSAAIGPPGPGALRCPPLPVPIRWTVQDRTGMGLASPAPPFPFGGRCEGGQGPGLRMATGARPRVLQRKGASSCSCVRVTCTVVGVGGQGPLRAWLLHHGAAGYVPGMKQERKRAQERQQRLVRACDCDRASICDCGRDRDPDRECPTARPTDSIHLPLFASRAVVAILTQELEVHPALNARGG